MNLDEMTTARIGRRDFLKACFLAMSGVILSRWLKPFEDVPKTGMIEARFYRSPDDLPG